MNKNLDITKTGPLNYKNLQEQNTLNSPILEEIPILLEPFKLPTLNEKLLLGTYDINTNYDLGSTRHDLDLYNISQLEHVKDIRAENQSAINKLGSSLVKGSVLAGTTFVDGTLGLIAGLSGAITNSFNLDSTDHREGFLGGLSYLWDNELSNGLLEINKIVENAIPNYSSDWEDNAPVWKKLGTANFWGEGVLKNMGFMVGAFYSGSAWTKALKAASILGKTSTMGARVTGSLLSATNEARIEANQTVENLRNLETLKLLDAYDKHYNDIINSDLDDASKINNLTILNKNLELEQLNIEDKMAKVGAIDFVSNVPLLMFDDFMLFGKLYSRGFSDAADVAKKIKGGASPLSKFKLILKRGEQLEAQEMSQVAKEGTQYIAKKVTDKEILAKSLKSAVREGNEELAQQMFSNFSGDLYAADGPDAYYNALYNPNAEVKVNKFIPSLVKSFNESYGTGSQWEQFAVGAISSLIGMPTFGKMNNSDNNTYLGKGKAAGLSGGILGEIKSQKATNEEAVLTADALNKVINRLADLKRHFVQTQSFTNAMDGFSEELDKFLYKNAEDNSDFSAIETFSKAGRLDDYLAIIDLDFENLSDEELNKIAATSSKFDAEGKVISGWKTTDGNLMSSTDLNTSEGKDLMRKELAKNRDKMKKQVKQYSEAVLRIRGLGNNTFTPEQTQELAWLLWKSDQFADRYKDIKETHNNTFNKYISTLNRAEESILHTRESLTLDMAFEDGIAPFKLNSHELEVIRTLRNFLSSVLEAATPAYLYHIIDKHPEVKDFIKDENIFNYTQYLAASEVKYSDYTKALLDLIDCRRLATVANQFLERFKEFTENPEKIERKRAVKADNPEIIAKAKKNINVTTQINGSTISLVVKDILNDASKFDDLDELLDKIDADALVKVKEAKLILDKKNQIQQNLSEKIQQGIISEETYEDAISLIEKSLSNAESLQEFTDLDSFSYQDIEAIEENLQKAESEFESLEEFDEAILDRIDAARTLLAETFNDIDIDDLELEGLPDNLDSLNDSMESIDVEENIPTLNELELIKQKENSKESLLLLTVVENFETAVENKAFLTKEETEQVFPIVKNVISEAAVLQKENITLEETKLAIADTDAINKLDEIIVDPEKLEIIFNEMISAIDAIFKSSETKDEDSSNVESEEIQMNGADLIPEYFEENNSRYVPEETGGTHAYWKSTTTEVPMHFTKGKLIPYHAMPKVIASKGTTPEYTRMKATHKYLTSLNAWENAYNAKKGDTVEIVIDPKLNTDAAQIVLLLQSNGKIVGDLIAEHDNIAVNQLYLPTFINSVLKEFKIWLDAGNTGKFVFSKKTTIALKLIGKVPYSDVSNMKTLNEIHKITNSEGLQVSVPFKLGIVMDDEGRVLMTPGRRAMDLQSEEETTILPKLRSKIGQPVLLMPTGVSNKAFIPVDITMPRYGLHPNIPAKIDAFIDLGLNSITTLLKGFEVKWILNLQELLSIPSMHVNIDNANNIKISVSAEKNGAQSIIYNGPLNNPNLPNILKTFLIGTPYLISRKYINKTFKNGDDYNTMMGELAIANLPVGGTHTISSWFTINPISEEGTQVEAAPIRSLQDNPLKTSRLFSTYTHVDKNGTRVIKVDNATFEVFDGTTGKKLSGVNSDIYAARTFISVNKSILTVPKDNIVATQWGDFNVKTRKFVDKHTSNPVYSFTSDELSNIGDIAVESKLGTSIGTFGKDLLENNDISTFTKELLDTQASKKGFISNPKDKKIWAALNDNDKQLLLNAPTIKAKEVLTVLSYNFNFIKKEFTSPQNITELLNPTKYRLELKIAKIDVINIRKEARWFAKVLPNLNREARLRIQEGIIKTANNLNAWGHFKDGVVTISKGAASGTIYHEAFHAVVSLLLTKSELETMFSEAKRIYENKSSIELEELLAEDFRKYILFLEKPIIGNTVSIFRTLKHIINNIIGKEIYLDNLFYRISRGDLKNRTTTSNKTQSIKEGVSELFESNPELVKIGSQQQYSKYLDTIFPDSKVKDIVYHISKSKIEKFDKKYLGSETSAPDTVLGFFFTDNLQSIQEIAKEKEKQLKDLGVEKEVLGSEITRAILNLKAPKTYNGFTQGVWRDLPDFEGSGESFKMIKRTGSKEDYKEVRERAIRNNEDGIVGALSIDMDEDGQPEILAQSIVAFEPEQIHMLGGKQDIEGFKGFVSNENNAQNVQYQLPQDREIEEFVASEKTIRDLTARMSDRIGIPVRFESDRSKQYKGKLENGFAVINLAYATLDTAIHEVLGHPIIRAIKRNKRYKNTDEEFLDGILDTPQGEENPLYQNLLKELEYGKGKEVLDRIKKDYVYKTPELGNLEVPSLLLPEIEKYVKDSNIKEESSFWYKDIEYFNGKITGIVPIEKIPYTLEEQQEEAIVELLGLMTAEKLDNVKDGKLISLLKRLLKEMKQFVRSLLKQHEVEIDKLPDNMTLGDLSDLLAYSNSKLILPGNEVIYTTPDNQQFKTYAEASKHIGDLAKSVEDVDLNNITLESKLSKEDLQKIEELEKQKKEKEDYLGSKKYQQDKDFELYKLNKELEELKNKKVEFYSQEPFLDLEDKEKYGFQDFDYIRVESTYGRGNEYHKDILGENYEGYYIHGYNIPTGKPKKKILPITKEQAIKIWEKDEGSRYEAGDRQEILRTEDSIRYLQEDGKIKYEISSIEQEIRNIKVGQNTIQNFIDRNKEYEQSREIIEEWKKVNNIQYNPEEVYSRGQEFVSVVGAYSDFDANLMMQNLLQHIEDNQKAGGEFTISAFTKPIDKTIGHLEGGGGKIKFKIYPKSQDIKWAANTDVFSGSVWDASEKVNKDKKSELLGVSYTKYPALSDVNSVQSNLANIIDNLEYHHNELGISLTGSNFRLEYDDNIPYSTKKLIDSINSILDQKYGKLVKPDISTKDVGKVVYRVGAYFSSTSIAEFNSKEEAQDFINKYKQENANMPFKEDLAITPSGVLKGIQPTQTNETLKESIYGVSARVIREIIGKEYAIKITRPSGGIEISTYYDNREDALLCLEENKNKYKDSKVELIENSKYGRTKEKEYISQALINIKIAKLKEVAKKYPRSLIRSEVKPYKSNSEKQDLFDIDELPFQLVSGKELGSKQDIEEFKKFVSKGTWEELFERYQNTKFEYINLNEENKQYLKDKKITQEIYDRMTRLEKEILFHCKA